MMERLSLKLDKFENNKTEPFDVPGYVQLAYATPPNSIEVLFESTVPKMVLSENMKMEESINVYTYFYVKDFHAIPEEAAGVQQVLRKDATNFSYTVAGFLVLTGVAARKVSELETLN